MIDYHYEGIKIEGHMSISYFEKVMDEYLKLLGKAKGVKYASFQILIYLVIGVLKALVKLLMI